MCIDNNFKLAGAGFRGRFNIPVTNSRPSLGRTFAPAQPQDLGNVVPVPMSGVETSQPAGEGNGYPETPLDGRVIMYEELPSNEKLKDTIKATMVGRSAIAFVNISRLSTGTQIAWSGCHQRQDAADLANRTSGIFTQVSAKFPSSIPGTVGKLDIVTQTRPLLAPYSLWLQP